MNSLKVLLTGIFISLVFVHCKNKETSEVLAEQGTPLYETEEFLAFYDQFGTDSIFQIEHITFPLEGKLAPKDSTYIEDPNFRWQKENWKIHKKFNDYEGTYAREFIDLSGKMVIERIDDETGEYSMERRFGKLTDGWNLIYYKEMGRH